MQLLHLLLQLTIACLLFSTTKAVHKGHEAAPPVLRGAGYSRASSGGAAFEEFGVSQLWPPYQAVAAARNHGRAIHLVKENAFLPTGTELPLPMTAPQEVVLAHIQLSIEEEDPTRCAAMLYVPGHPEQSRIPKPYGMTQKLVLIPHEQPKNLRMYIPENCRVLIKSFAYFTLEGLEALAQQSTVRRHASTS